MTGEGSTGSQSADESGNKMSTLGGMLKSHRTPPPLKLDFQPYLMWKKDVEIWQILTSLPKEKQGLDLYMSLEQKYKQFVNLTVQELSAVTGVESIIAKLDELLL